MAVRVVVPGFETVTGPEPEMVEGMVSLVEDPRMRVALLTIELNATEAVLVLPPMLPIPPLIVNVPVAVLAPVRVNVPVPVLVTEPPVPVNEPAKVVVAFVPPTLRVFAPRAAVPAPAIEPMVSLLALVSRVAPALTVKALLSGKLLDAFALAIVPFRMVVIPV